MAQFTQPFNLNASTAGGPGPAASGNFINVDFGSNPNGQVVSQYVWGVSDGGVLGNQSFSSFNDGTLAPLLTQLAFPLYRFNSQCGYTERLFPGGSTSVQGIGLSGEFATLISRFPSVCPGARLIMGLGFGPNNWGSSGAFASVCSQIASYFNTNAPGLVYGWEIGNENDGLPSYYTSYFNAAAVAIKAVNPNLKVFGPTFSYDNQLNVFASSCASHCDVLDYHAYQYGGEGEFDAGQNGLGGQAYIENKNLFNGLASDLNTYVSGGGSNTTPIFIGEYNGNNTYGTLNGGQSPGVCNTYMQNGTSAIVNSTTILSGLNSTPNFQMAGIWSVWLDSDYGVIGGTDNVNGGSGYTPCPGGYLLSQAGKTTFGKRASVASGGSGSGNSQWLATSGGTSASGFAVMIINPLINPSGGTDGAISGQVALSHWPVNTSGTASINYWQCGDTHPTPLTNTVNVTAGLTASISVPANSVVILWSP